MDTVADAPSTSVLLVLGQGRYAVPMAAVAEVARVPTVTRVPGVPDWLVGVGNWRGRVLPVVDLRGLLGEPAGPLGAAGRLVVCSLDGLTVGVLADRVDGVAALDLADPDPLAVAAAPGAAGLLDGQVSHDGAPVALVRPSAVVGLRTLLPRPTYAS